MIGASNRPGIGHAIVKNLLDMGYCGKVFAVNRKGEDVLGVPGYTDVREIPGDVDLGVLSVPSAGILDVAEACGQKGVPALVCITAGFREIGPEGAAREKELMRIVDKYNMRIVGPNCMGVANTAPGVRLSATILSETPPVGSVAFLTQSGALGASLIDFAGELDVGFSVVVSLGNMTNVNPCDLLPMLEADENTKIICMYMETIPEPYRFERVMARMTKPVIVVKSGRTAKGAAAASSHTGSLAGNDSVADALLKKCGVIRAENLEDAFLLASSMTKMPRLHGNRVGIISNAGGLGTLTTDALVKYGFELPELDPDERAALAPQLLPEASTHNPLDLVAPAPPAHYAIAAHAMIDSGKYDAIIVDCVPPATVDTGEVAQAMVDILKSTSIPIFSCFFGPTLGAAGRAVMKKGGIPTFSFPDQMVRTMRYMVEPAPAEKSVYDCHISAEARTEARRLMDSAAPDAYLPAEDCFRLLRLYNIPMAQSSYLPVGGSAEALALDYPVVAKVDHPDIIHKSDVGGVRLGLANAQELDALLRRVDGKVPGLRGIPGPAADQRQSGNDHRRVRRPGARPQHPDRPRRNAGRDFQGRFLRPCAAGSAGPGADAPLAALLSAARGLPRQHEGQYRAVPADSDAGQSAPARLPGHPRNGYQSADLRRSARRILRRRCAHPALLSHLNSQLFPLFILFFSSPPAAALPAAGGRPFT